MPEGAYAPMQLHQGQDCWGASLPSPPHTPPQLLLGAELGPATTPPGQGQAQRRLQGRDGGQSTSVFGLGAWPRVAVKQKQN